MTVGRAIPSSLAPVLAQLELHRPTIVTQPWIQQRISDAGSAMDASTAIRRLRELGWLIPLRVQGAWEFAPADRAGRLSGGDPFIEARALSAVRPTARVHIGLESALFLRSLASRQPAQEVLLIDSGTPAIRALDNFRRVEMTLPDSAFSTVDGLQVQTPAGVLATLAIRPSAFKDWPSVAEWLATAAARSDAATMAGLLAGRPAAAWARAAYLLRRGNNAEAAVRLNAVRPVGNGPFYLGPRSGPGAYDKETDVIDSLVARYAETDQGHA